MLRVTVDNFQSIEHAEIKVDGFAALVGRSNIGKSALVRAIRYALTGAQGSDFVRHDPATCTRIRRDQKKCKCQCSVRIEVEGHLTLLWEKGDAINQYTTWDVAGRKQVYDKVDRGNLGFLGEGFEPIKVGSDKVLVQVASQFKPIFLLDESGSVVADVLSDVAKLDDLNEALRLAEKDRRSNLAERKVRERDLVATQESLAGYDGLDQGVAKVKGLGSTRDQLTELSDELDRLAGFLSRLEEYAVSIRGLRAATTSELPAPQRLQGGFRNLLDLRRFERDYDTLTGRVGVLTAAIKPTLSEPPRKQQEALVLLTGWDRRLSGLRPRVELLEQTCLVDLPDPASIRLASDELRRLNQWLEDLRRLKVAFLSIRDALASELPDQAVMRTRYQQFVWLCEKSTAHEALIAKVSTLELRYADVEREVENLLKEFNALGACPVCEQRIDPGHRLIQ